MIFTKEQIDEYFKTLNETPETEETKPEETEQNDDRGLLLDVPLQAIGGVADAGKSALRLIEGVVVMQKRITGVGGLDIW